MKKLCLLGSFILLAYSGQGQTYNNLTNYSLLNNFIGHSRTQAHTSLTKAGYKFMTYTEVCEKEQEVFPKEYFNITAHYRYVPKAGSSKGPYYVTVIFDPEVGPDVLGIQWNEYMTPGRGDVMDKVLTAQGLKLLDTIEGSVSGPKATAMYFINDLRTLIFNGHEGTRLVKFTLAVKRM
ncbi:hypothetical protein DNI29_19395 [Hymenobacter sediminis]|uniref:hypothetical protein n=1 Tax=Hymenobacter sediminis TaxID=2218621 RepID=UPI000DA6866C|nr:hypothetical protein [Hymenobacter sediminis]RPD44869.1 hypothetical protein DNI29_19395 [Hymenobacter sediminis]